MLWAAEVLQVRPPSSVEVSSRFVTGLYMRIDNDSTDSLSCNLQTVTGAGLSGLSAVTVHEHSTEDQSTGYGPPRHFDLNNFDVVSSFISVSELQVRDEDQQLSCNLQMVTGGASELNAERALNGKPQSAGYGWPRYFDIKNFDVVSSFISGSYVPGS